MAALGFFLCIALWVRFAEAGALFLTPIYPIIANLQVS
jgi:hypothetical protein